MSDKTYREALEEAVPQAQTLLRQFLLDIEPSIVAFVRWGDGLTEQDWADIPNEYYDAYRIWKRSVRDEHD